jgi:hypothetical protein
MEYESDTIHARRDARDDQQRQARASLLIADADRPTFIRTLSLSENRKTLNTEQFNLSNDIVLNGELGETRGRPTRHEK